jgi:hypothetical protein
MADKEWCIDGDTPYSQLDSAVQTYIAEFERIHALVPEAEWTDISAEFGESKAAEKFKEKPEEIFGGEWWRLKEPVEPWGNYKGSEDVKNKSLTFVRTEELKRKIIRDLNGSFSDALQKFLNSEEVVLTGDEEQISGLQGILDFISSFTVILESMNFTYNSLEELVNNFYRDYYRFFNDEMDQAFQDTIDNGIEPLRNELLSFMYNCPDEKHFTERYSMAVMALGELEVERFKNQQEGRAKSAARGRPGGDPTIGLDAAQVFRNTITEDRLEKFRQKIQKRIKQELEEAFADNLIFSEQCFMLTNIDKILQHRKAQNLNFPLPYYTGEAKDPDLCGTSIANVTSKLNQPLLIQGEPFSFMNKMAVEPDQQFLFDLMPHEISSLTPNIELYKVVSEEFDGELTEYEIPIKFDIQTKSPRIENVYNSQRGTGVGVKSFSFSYDGTDPFSAKKAISADLSIFASSFTKLIERRDQYGNTNLTDTTNVPGIYRYTDLALKTGTAKLSSDTETLDNSNSSKLEREQLDKLNFRLKVVVQWAAAPDAIRSIKREEIKKALYNSAITMYLTPVIHTFDFDDNGGVTFNISYKAYIEDYFTNDNFNVFSDLSAIRELRRHLIDYFKDKNCDLINGEEFKLFQQADSRFIINKNRQSLNSIISGLHNRKVINYLNMTYKDIENWMKNPDNYAQEVLPIDNGTDGIKAEDVVDEAIQKYDASKDEEDKRDMGDLRLSLVANSQDNQSIAFFYLSDLISVVMNMMETNFASYDDMKILNEKYLTSIAGSLTKININDFRSKVKKELQKKKYITIDQFKKLRVVLGPMEIRRQQNSILCSVGDIPISLNYFIEFLADKVIAKDLINYPLSKFIKDIINELVREFLNSEDCSAANSSQRLSINSTTIVGYNNLDDGTDTITELGLGFLGQPKEFAEYYGNYYQKGVFILDEMGSNVPFPLVKISADRNNPNTSKSIDMMTNFYVFSVGRSYPTEKYVGDREIDSQSGIFHYMLGQDRGIVKSIKLQKTNTPGLKEVRFEQEGYEGLEQLREVYNASIECYLNPQTFPGTYIYVPPEGFSPDSYHMHLVDNKGNPIDLTKFGIGGYYMITNTKHTISPGVGNTAIEASWVASKDGSYGKRDPETKKRGDGEGNEKVKKCKIAARGNTNNRQ